MGFVTLPTGDKIAYVSRTEGADVVEHQAVTTVDPTSGTPVDFATQTTLAQLKAVADTIYTAALAIQTEVTSLDAKTSKVNTDAVTLSDVLDLTRYMIQQLAKMSFDSSSQLRAVLSGGTLSTVTTVSNVSTGNMGIGDAGKPATVQLFSYEAYQRGAGANLTRT